MPVRNAGVREKAKVGKVAKRHPAILRTNHQIYAEATSYLDLILVLHPGDTISFHDCRDDIIKPSKGPWRHNSMSFKHDGANYFDVTDGYLEPYVFSRFQKIGFQANYRPSLALDRPNAAWTLFTNDKMKMSAVVNANFACTLKNSRTTRHLAQLLFLNATIKSIDFRLFLQVGLTFDSDIDSLNERQLPEHDAQDSEKIGMAGERDSLRGRYARPTT